MLSVVGCHAEGEVGDVIVGGFLPPPARPCSSECWRWNATSITCGDFCFANPAGACVAMLTC